MAKGIEKGRAEGIAAGMAKGIEKGIEKGMEKGMEKEKEDTVHRLIAKGFDIATISIATGMSEGEIKEMISK